MNWLPDYLVTSRGLTMLRAGIYAALPYLVFGMSEPIGGWIADRLIVSGWNETRVRKGIVTFAFLTGLLLIPAARVDSAGTAVALIIGGCLVGLATGNLLVILQNCAPRAEIGLWTGIYNFVGNIAGHPVADHHRRADREDRLLHAPVHPGRRAHRSRTAGLLVHRARSEAAGVESCPPGFDVGRAAPDSLC